MGFPMGDINGIANAMASHERNENNRGRRVNQEGWMTHEQARHNAAQYALAMVLAVGALTLLAKLLIFLWRYKAGRVIILMGVGVAATLLAHYFEFVDDATCSQAIRGMVGCALLVIFIPGIIKVSKILKRHIVGKILLVPVWCAAFFVFVLLGVMIFTPSDDVANDDRTVESADSSKGEHHRMAGLDNKRITKGKPTNPKGSASEIKYACRFCGRHTFNRAELDGSFCADSPRLHGRERVHQVILAEDYREPVSRMCVRCGFKTKFTDVFVGEPCPKGGAHAFFVTKTVEPEDYSERIRSSSEKYVCAYCGIATSHKEAFEGSRCGGYGTHKLVTPDEYLQMKTFRCRRCGLETRFPELRQSEECEQAFGSCSHDFKEENRTTDKRECHK